MDFSIGADGGGDGALEMYLSVHRLLLLAHNGVARAERRAATMAGDSGELRAAGCGGRGLGVPRATRLAAGGTRSWLCASPAQAHGSCARQNARPGTGGGIRGGWGSDSRAHAS